MTDFRYTAIDRGQLASGHSELTEYIIQVPLASNSRNVVRQGVEQVSLSGRRFYTSHRQETNYSMTTTPLHVTQDSGTIELFYEMLSSVIQGETLEIDFGSGFQTFVLDGGYSESIVDNYFRQYSFKVISA